MIGKPGRKVTSYFSLSKTSSFYSVVNQGVSPVIDIVCVCVLIRFGPRWISELIPQADKNDTIPSQVRRVRFSIDELDRKLSEAELQTSYTSLLRTCLGNLLQGKTRLWVVTSSLHSTEGDRLWQLLKYAWLRVNPAKDERSVYQNLKIEQIELATGAHPCMSQCS